MKLRMGPVAGLWMAAGLSLIAIVSGMSPKDGTPVVAVGGAICFTLSAGFLALVEAIEKRG